MSPKQSPRAMTRRIAERGTEADYLDTWTREARRAAHALAWYGQRLKALKIELSRRNRR